MIKDTQSPAVGRESSQIAHWLGSDLAVFATASLKTLLQVRISALSFHSSPELWLPDYLKSHNSFLTLQHLDSYFLIIHTKLPIMPARIDDEMGESIPAMTAHVSQSQKMRPSFL